MGTPVKWGREFLVNTTRPGDQFDSSITWLADGRFVISWTDTSQTGGDPSGHAVRAQVFNADSSRLGAEFLVNTTTQSDQYQPHIAGLPDGRFVVTWTDSTGADVRGQVWNIDGSKSGPEFVVNTTVTGGHGDSAVTALESGGFVVVWNGFSVAADMSGLHCSAQIYNADGSALGGEFLVNSTVYSDQWRPKVTPLTGGGFVVTWQDISGVGGDTSGYSVRAQIFDANGAKSGTEFLVNTHTFGWQADPNITALADGRFVVTWQDYQPLSDDPNGLAARAQVFNADGTKSGSEFLANTTTLGGQSGPSLVALADGRYVIAWVDSSQTGSDASGYAVVAQLFNSDGSKSGIEFPINTTASGNQYLESMTALADGRFVVTWADDGRTGGDHSGFAIRAQIFDPREAAVDLTGTALADDFIGTAFDDQMQGLSGDDRLIGRIGIDLLIGDAGNDDLQGRVGADSLTGGAGNDTLAGGRDDDLLTGDAGLDTFIFAKGGGHDVITDFADGIDRIDLSSFGFATFAAAQAQFTASGSDLVFTKGAVVLTLNNFALADLSPDDLIL